jgi:hypothetical protein
MNDRTSRHARPIIAAILIAAPLLVPPVASAQDDSPTTQLWANMTLGFPSENPKWFYEVDFEPKVQVSGPEKWAGTTINTLASLRPIHWLDLTGDVSVDYTVQNNDLQTLSIVPRIGAAFHILSNIRETGFISEKVQRLGMATLLRLEWRNFWYTGDAAEESYESSWRFRLRFDIRLGLNRADRSMPRTWYLFADAEAFINLGDPIEETFNSRWRVRIGPGYRLNRGWRFELLYMFEDTRNTLEGDFERSVNAIDLRAGYNF